MKRVKGKYICGNQKINKQKFKIIKKHNKIKYQKFFINDKGQGKVKKIEVA